MQRRVQLQVNDELWELDIEPHKTLLEILHENLGLTGAKEGCGLGACGSCTVIIDGAPVLSCLTMAIGVQNKSIYTIEGLGKKGEPDPLQQAFVEHGALQCGFCSPGAIMSSKALLGRTSNPSREDIKDALSGNLCRCTGYQKIIEAVESVAKR